MLRLLEKWTVRRVQVMHNGHERLDQQRFELVKNEKDVIGSFNITEIREVQELFQEWKDPYKIDGAH